MELVSILPLLIILGAFMWFSARKQRKAMQATIDLHESLQIGDRIHTTSGLEGTITGITDDSVDLEIAPGVVTRWMKLAVRDHVDSDEATEESTAAEAPPLSATGTDDRWTDPGPPNWPLGKD
jgi:preprotein translocase subunit YajC